MLNAQNELIEKQEELITGLHVVHCNKSSDLYLFVTEVDNHLNRGSIKEEHETEDAVTEENQVRDMQQRRTDKQAIIAKFRIQHKCIYIFYMALGQVLL